MTRIQCTLCFALTFCVALASTDAYAQRRGGGKGNDGGGGRGNDGGGGRGNNSEPRGQQPRAEQPRAEQPRVEQPRVEQPRVEQPRVEQPRVRVPEVRTPNVRVPEVRVPGVSGDVRGGASGGVRVDGGNARVRTDGSADGNIRVGEGNVRVRGDGRVDGSVRRAGATFPNNVDRAVNQAIYRNNISIGQRSFDIAPNTYRPSYQNYSWHRGYWNNTYGWNPQIGYGQGFGGYGNYGGYGIRLGNVVIGTGGGYGGYGGGYGGYGYGRYPMGWGYGGWGLGNVLYRSGYSPYFNPYWGDGIGGANYAYDYAQPIYVTTSSATTSNVATRDFDSARKAFKAGDYDTAMALINRAIKENPSDGVLHEFRALTQFAMKDYNGSAATIHSVLAVGPGWDWATMASLYADVEDYTAQLRALEGYTKSHSDEAGAKFLLGYHYMTTGHPDAAAKQFANVVQLEPKDRVAREMLALVDKPKDGEVVEATPPAPREEAEPVARPSEDARPISADAIAGTWQSSRDDGSKFDLDLKADKTFMWKFNQGSRNEDFSGTYTTEGSLLVLQRKDGGAMVGHVAQNGDGKFTFKLLGAPQDDPGLTFSR